jgi:hypothetical protein
MNSSRLMKQPSALLPMAMSLAALAIVLGHVAMYGSARETDEGAAAHIFQLLMIAQLPIIGFFAIKQLRRTPGQTLLILALQAGAAFAAFTPVFVLGL